MPAPPPPLGRLNAEPATQLRQRPTKDGSRLNYPCPLFEYSPYSDGIMGLSLNSIQWDVLHVIDLGVTQRLAGTVLQSIIWHPEDLLATGHDAAEERLAHGVQALSVRLTEFYNLRKDLSDKALSELRKITPAMVGPREAPNLHAKGAETRHLLPWLQQLLLEFGPRLGDEGMHLTLLPQILPLSVLPASLACPPPPAYRRLAPISGTFVVSSWKLEGRQRRGRKEKEGRRGRGEGSKGRTRMQGRGPIEGREGREGSKGKGEERRGWTGREIKVTVGWP